MSSPRASLRCGGSRDVGDCFARLLSSVISCSPIRQGIDGNGPAIKPRELSRAVTDTVRRFRAFGQRLAWTERLSPQRLHAIARHWYRSCWRMLGRMPISTRKIRFRPRLAGQRQQIMVANSDLDPRRGGPNRDSLSAKKCRRKLDRSRKAGRRDRPACLCATGRPPLSLSQSPR